MAVPTFFRNDGFVKATTGQAVPGAQIYVALQPANIAFAPPSPLATIYSDPNGLVPITQPILTDGFGHYDFYVLPGTYTVMVALSGVVQQVYADQTIGQAGLPSNILTTTNVSAGSNMTITTVGGITTFSASGGGGGSGTVTSVAMTVPSILSVSGSPVTTSGTLAVSLVNESANTVFAGPISGGAATPTFRSLVGSDLPIFSSGAFTQYASSGNNTVSVTANTLFVAPFTMPFSFSFNNMAWVLNAQDGAHLYDFGIYDLGGNRLCHTGAIALLINGGGQSQFAPVGSTTLSAGTYLWAMTANNTNNNFFVGSTSTNLLYYSTATASSGGVLPATITLSTSVTSGTSYIPTMIIY
jgi:hypothetical protein